jgi:hypothetical protein
MATFDLLMSANVYSGNLDEPESLSKLIKSVAKIDRLPSENTLEAMKILRNTVSFRFVACLFDRSAYSQTN